MKSAERRQTTEKAAKIVLEARHGFTIYRNRSEIARSVLTKLLPDPELLMAAGRTLVSPWQSAATDKFRVEIDGAGFFLKRYNPVSLWYRLKNSVRPSKALKGFAAGHRFLAEGLPTPEPLLCLDERKWRLLGNSYLVFPFIDDGMELLDVWPAWTEEEKSAALGTLAKLVGRMHSRGILHGDLNWRNILVAGAGRNPDFLLVDLAASRFGGPLDPWLAEKDLDHFLRDLRRIGARPDAISAFLCNWRVAAGFDTTVLS